MFIVTIPSADVEPLMQQGKTVQVKINGIMRDMYAQLLPYDGEKDEWDLCWNDCHIVCHRTIVQIHKGNDLTTFICDDDEYKAGA